MAIANNQRFQAGDQIRLKKPHACGGDVWEILRVGIDFRLQCLTCGHQITFPREEVSRRVKDIVKTTREGE